MKAPSYSNSRALSIPMLGQEHAVVAQSQPSSSSPQVPPSIPIPTPPPITTSTPPSIPTPTPPPIPTSTPPSIPTPTPPPNTTPTPPPITTPTPPPIPTPSPPPPITETEPTQDEHIYEEQSPVHHHFSPPQEQAPSHMPMDDLLHEVPKLISKIGQTGNDLKQTKNFGFGQNSEEEEPEAQRRKSKDDPLDSSVQGLVTPPTIKVNTLGEEQVEEISQNILEAAKTLSNVASLKSRSIDKGRRYKRRKETKGKKVVSSLDFQGEVDAGAEQVNSASAEQNCQKEDELTEQQKKKKSSCLFEAQHYTNEDWDLIRAKIEANAELSKSMLGSELQGEDFAKKMVDLVNKERKYFAEGKS
ncbi:hypothetical protein Tco_0591712 [Tanacetum coccineum]